MKDLLSWLTNFDALKGVFIAIVAVLGSWYDLKSTVEINRSAAVSAIEMAKVQIEAQKEHQKLIDEHQNELIVSMKEDINNGFKDLKGELRARR